MKTFSATLIGSLSAAVIAAVVCAYPARTQTAPPTPDTVEAHLAAGKNAAGGRDNTPDFYGLVTAICVAPLNGAARPDAPAPREDPNRKATYMEPMQAFDDLYWMGTPSTSSWLLTSDDGYILYDTQRVHDAEDVLVDGMKKLDAPSHFVSHVTPNASGVSVHVVAACNKHQHSRRNMTWSSFWWNATARPLSILPATKRLHGTLGFR
jgi:hypothetical protein